MKNKYILLFILLTCLSCAHSRKSLIGAGGQEISINMHLHVESTSHIDLYTNVPLFWGFIEKMVHFSSSIYEDVFEIKKVTMSFDNTLPKSADIFNRKFLNHKNDGYVHVYFIPKYYVSRYFEESFVGGYTSTGLGCKNFIIITEDASLSTLAHELGHYFGLHHHKNIKNIMAPGEKRKGKIKHFVTKKQKNIIMNHLIGWKHRC